MSSSRPLGPTKQQFAAVFSASTRRSTRLVPAAKTLTSSPHGADRHVREEPRAGELAFIALTKNRRFRPLSAGAARPYKNLIQNEFS
jgi:hypothetical protein